MTSTKSSCTRLTRRPYDLLFVLSAIVCVCSGFNYDGKSPAIDIAGRDANIVQIGERHDINYHSALVSRQTGQCGPGLPCSNGACCGASGYCGYGSAYCGTGCLSNCGAYAECGQFAQTNGTQCPLNTCCSQFGFVSCQVQKTTILSYCTDSF
jgi:hypothetical protein